VPLSPDDSRSPYLQIADALRTEIQRGELTPASQLPSATDLAARFGVARNTVRSALRLLTEEGLLVSRQGSGVFVRSTLPQAPSSTVSDSARIDELLRSQAEMQQEIRSLRQRVTHLESRRDHSTAD
jgi:DNA-binding GntR family transcriptional regulator